MKKSLAVLLLVASCTLSNVTYANWFQDIIDVINKQAAISNGLLSNEVAMQRDILSAQQDIDGLMKTLNGHVTGHSGWGDYGYHDYQSYGDGAHDWTAVMQMAGRGLGNGELGRVIGEIANQFPSNINTFNRAVSDLDSQKYYALKSQTVLAERAASELDYNKIQDQISYQQMLRQSIEKANDLKSALDLLNRIQIEANLINLQVLRQNSLSTQQQAVTEQAVLNSALSNARFLTK